MRKKPRVRGKLARFCWLSELFKNSNDGFLFYFLIIDFTIVSVLLTWLESHYAIRLFISAFLFLFFSFKHFLYQNLLLSSLGHCYDFSVQTTL